MSIQNPLIATAIASLKRVLTTHQLTVAWSGGKDSSVVLGLALQAARELKGEGFEIQPLVVTHGDTTVENPEIRLYADQEIQRIRRFGAKHGIPVEVLVARPSLTESWQCRVIGGRALPAFPGMNHDCTTSMKIQPMNRMRKALLGKEAKHVVTVIGTRFEESPQRAARMTERGETPDKPWVGDDGGLYLSPIALWEMGDVWEYLGMCRAGDPDVTTFSNFEDVFRIYADAAGSSCAVVGDMASKGNAKPCGARTGCWNCTPIGRDKSLEAMIDGDERYGYMRGLNLLQRFLVNTRWDLSRRLWLGRTVDDQGYVAVQPDVYSPDMLKELLQYTLTLDQEEREASAALGIAPRFEIIDLRTLLAIDAMWSLQGYHHAFEAMRVYRAVVEEGKRYPVPHTEEFARPAVLPKTRWLHVGLDYANDARLIGLRDLTLELVGESDSGCMGTRQTRDGRTILDVNTSAAFDVDAEAAGLFLEFEFERVLQDFDNGLLSGPGSGYLYYARMGIVSIAPQAVSTVDEIMRRTWWKWNQGWFGQVSTEALLAKSVSVREPKAAAESEAAEAAVAVDAPVVAAVAEVSTAKVLPLVRPVAADQLDLFSELDVAELRRACGGER